MRIRDGTSSDPGSGMENIRIWDKHPGSATLSGMEIFGGIPDPTAPFSSVVDRRSGSDYPFWCQSGSWTWFYPRFYTCWKIRKNLWLYSQECQFTLLYNYFTSCWPLRFPFGEISQLSSRFKLLLFSSEVVCGGGNSSSCGGDTEGGGANNKDTIEGTFTCLVCVISELSSRSKLLLFSGEVCGGGGNSSSCGGDTEGGGAANNKDTIEGTVTCLVCR